MAGEGLPAVCLEGKAPATGQPISTEHPYKLFPPGRRPLWTGGGFSGSSFRGLPAFGGIISTAIRTCPPQADYPIEAYAS